MKNTSNCVFVNPLQALMKVPQRRILPLICLSVGVSCVLTAMASGETNQINLNDNKQYEQDFGEIKSIESRKDIKDYDREFEKQADAINIRWKQRNKEMHASLVLELCRLISSGRFGNSREHGLARKYALASLKEAEILPIETEIKLVGNVVTDLISPNAPKGTEWSVWRSEDTRAWLHAWKRLNEGLDSTWDLNEKIFTDDWSEAELKMIKNTKEQRQYEARHKVALQENSKAMERHNQQLKIRKQLKWFVPEAKSRIIYEYSHPPYADKELRDLLNAYGIAQDAQTYILDEVTNKKEATKSNRIKASGKVSAQQEQPVIGRRKQAVPKVPDTHLKK